MRGDVLISGHPDYENARHVWNGMFDRHPALIARCTGADDVRRSRQLRARAGPADRSPRRRAQRLRQVVLRRRAGHRPAGDAGRARRSRGAAGDTPGRVPARPARPRVRRHGLATPVGTYSITGAAGLTLSGGFGRLGRRFGLACDNVVSFDVVTADGRFLRRTTRRTRTCTGGCAAAAATSAS